MKTAIALIFLLSIAGCDKLARVYGSVPGFCSRDKERIAELENHLLALSEANTELEAKLKTATTQVNSQSTNDNSLGGRFNFLRLPKTGE